MRVGCRVQQDLRRVPGTGGQHHDAAAECLLLVRPPSRDTTTPVTVRPEASVSQPDDLGVHQQRHVARVEQRPDRDDVSVGLGVDQARVAVARRAPDAMAGGLVGLVQHDPARGRERVVGLAPARRRFAGSAARATPAATGIVFTRILRSRSRAVHAMHVIQPLGPGVPGLEIGVAQRPGWATRRRRGTARQSPPAEPVQRRPVQLVAPPTK